MTESSKNKENKIYVEQGPFLATEFKVFAFVFFHSKKKEKFASAIQFYIKSKMGKVDTSKII